MAESTVTHINKLAPAVAARAYLLVYIARLAGYPVVITSSQRTFDQQSKLVREGRSQTLASKHLEGRAFDIDWQGWHRDSVPEMFWHKIGPFAERYLGLKWGGRWSSLRDYGHFEL